MKNLFSRRLEKFFSAIVESCCNNLTIGTIVNSIYQNPDHFHKWLELFVHAFKADFYRQKRDPLAVSWEAFALHTEPVSYLVGYGIL